MNGPKRENKKAHNSMEVTKWEDKKVFTLLIFE